MSFELIAAGLVIYLGMVLQGTVGFGAALFAIPVLIWLGIELPHAVTLIAMAVIVQASIGAYTLRAHIRKKEVLLSTTLRFIGLPLGIWLLTIIEGLDKTQIKQVVGVIVLVLVLAQMFFRVRPRDAIHPFWAILAFLTSGILVGTSGMGGPPLVFWVMAHRWSTQETRAFLFCTFVAITPVLVLSLCFSFGEEILWYVLVGLLFSPFMAHGSKLGIQLGNKLSKEQQRFYAFLLLFLIAVSSILAPVMPFAK